MLRYRRANQPREISRESERSQLWLDQYCHKSFQLMNPVVFLFKGETYFQRFNNIIAVCIATPAVATFALVHLLKSTNICLPCFTVCSLIFPNLKSWLMVLERLF